MNTQPVAMRLADELNEAAGDYDAWHKRLGYDAAAELRRLHEVNKELSEALKTLRIWCGLDRYSDTWINSGAPAAIAKAEAS